MPTQIENLSTSDGFGISPYPRNQLVMADSSPENHWNQDLAQMELVIEDRYTADDNVVFEFDTIHTLFIVEP
jgi:hypothetical protein